MSTVTDNNTGTLVIRGAFDYWIEKRTGERVPSLAELAVMGADRDEIDAILSLLPKSVRMHANTLHAANGEKLGYASASIKLAQDGVNGGKNETGIKRLHAAIRAAERAGLDVVYSTAYGNSYGSLDELLAAIA